MTIEKFYDSLNIVPSFRDVSDFELYTPLPDEWHIALADIRDSTDAIRLGKYKEVNMAGASIIAAINNYCGEDSFLPYLFGGDGSMIVLPGNNMDEIRGLLSFCKDAVHSAFALEMATGIISMKDIRRAGHDIRMARLSMSDIIDQPVFWGSGVTYAEELIKQKDTLIDATPTTADFSGLECRWNQIPSDKDEVAAYIIQAFDKDDEESADIYERCFQKIEEIYGKEDDFHPIREEGLSMTAKPKFLGIEWKLKTQPPTFFRKVKQATYMLFQLVSGLYFLRFEKKTSKTNWGNYKPDLVRHADYKKFGDGLRFVATGTVQQRIDLTGFLETEFAKENLVYGVHASFAAIVTCFVKNYQSNHIHFVDGTDGGYAKASQELKNRREKLENKTT